MPQNDKTTKENLKKLASRKDLYKKFDDSEEALTWCSGCGNYNIQNALKRALTLENIPPEKTLLCFDIGCHGNGSDKMGVYTFHGLHGRAISLATGCKLGNSELTVMAIAGDGGTFSEGVNHLIHAVRNDYPIVFLHHNNSNYALTTGQPSATTKPGIPMNSAPDGVFIDPINPLELVLGANPTFVARAFSGDIKHLTKIIREGIKHNGFAFIEILQICTTYYKIASQKWYQERIRYIEDLPNYNPTNLDAARKLALDLEKEIHLGILYQDKKHKNFLSRLPNRQSPKTTPAQEVSHQDVSKLIKEFT